MDAERCREIALLYASELLFIGNDCLRKSAEYAQGGDLTKAAEWHRAATYYAAQGGVAKHIADDIKQEAGMPA